MTKRRVSAKRDEPRREYDFGGGTRGTFAVRYRQGTNLVVIAPDLAELFPDSAAVNRVLRAVASVARREARLPAAKQRRRRT